MEPVTQCLTPESARQLVAVRADPAVQERIDYLADRSTEGQLTADERAEYETYVSFIDFISLLQAKARRIVAENPASNGSGN
jgi:hypothetical protein